jgi:hypothetical protein
MPPVSFPKEVDLDKLFRTLSKEETVHEIANGMRKFLDQNAPGSSRYLPTDQQIDQVRRELSRAFNPNANSSSETPAEQRIPKNYFPFPAQHRIGHASSNGQGNNEFVLLSFPSDGEAHQLLSTLLRDAFPSGRIHQESLQSFLNHPEAQKIFQGNQSTAGFALLLAKDQATELLSSRTIMLPSSEVSKALEVLQTLIPNLLGQEGPISEQDPFQVSTQPDFPKIFDAFIEALQYFGFEDLSQDLLISLLKDSALESTAFLQHQTDFPEELTRQIQTLNFLNFPLAQGMKYFFQGNLPQDLAQMLQPLLRVLAGLFLVKTDTVWPKALPDEAALARLATIFASQTDKANERKERDRRKSKRRQGSLPFQAFQPENRPESESSEENDEVLSAMAS